MIRSRIVASTTLAVALLVSAAPSVLAQTEADGEIPPPVPVTGSGPDLTVSCAVEDSPGLTPEAPRLAATCDTELTMSDTRLEGEVTRDTERVFLDYAELGPVSWGEGDGPIVAYSSYVISNDGGTWRERPRAAIWTGPSEDPTYPLEAVATMVLDGEDGYEGLVAVLERTADATTAAAYSGVIMDARLMPSVPGALAAE